MATGGRRRSSAAASGIAALRRSSRPRPFGTNLVPEHLPLALEASLERLGPDYIDLYYIHWPNPDVPLAETMGALDRLVEAGKVRGVGICNFGPRNLKGLAALR